MMDDLRSRAAWDPVDHSHDPDVAGGRPLPEFLGQRGGERRQPAFGGRVGREEPVAHRHRRAAPGWKGAGSPGVVTPDENRTGAGKSRPKRERIAGADILTVAGDYGKNERGNIGILV